MAKTETKKQKKPARVMASKSKTSSYLRRRKLTPKQAKAKAKAEVKNHPPIPSAFKLTSQSVSFIKKFWKPLLGIVLVYTILNLIFASNIIGTIGSSVHNIKTSGGGKFGNALSGFGTLAVSGNGLNQSSGIQTFLLILESLVVIWALRHLFADEKIGIKQAYYHSMAPLIPFLLVIFVTVVQLLPVVVSSAALVLVSSIISGAAWVVALMGVIFILCCIWSLRMVSSSIFALYIVTLPDMEPRRALKAAKNLVRFRRLQIIRKILFGALSAFIFIGIIVVPLILFASFLVAPIFFVLSMLMVLYAHTYLYSLYKGLLA